jgi:hypothetical protein
MGATRTYTHAFDFWYKWAPSGSEELPPGWPTQSINTNGVGRNLFNGFYNFQFSGFPALTRHTASISGSDGALPWGSPAADLLWNVLVPSASIASSSVFQDGTNRNTTTYTFAYTSKSFFYESTTQEGPFGLLEYPITSSWIAYEPKLIQSNNEYRVRRNDPGSSTTYFPASLQVDGNLQTLVPYAKPFTQDKSIPSYGYATNTSVRAPFPPGFNPTSIQYTSAATGSNDGRFFDLAGGCGITRAGVSASLVDWETNKNSTLIAGREAAITALKKRRLFFPTISAPSASASGPFAAPYTGTEWFSLANEGSTGNTAGIFDENGGIYNVRFTLKRDVSNGFYPDSGGGSELLVYIFDINRPRLSKSGVASLPGEAGYYPPNNNIVRIKNEPAMSFVNPATGFLVESFNINVVQYGLPAQLVFEASGSLSTEKYFGCIIDDVSFCKVGVSTDPSLIKPQTTGIFIEEAISGPKI